MQRLFHKRDTGSHLEEVPVERLPELLDQPGYVWLDLSQEPAEAVWSLRELFSLDHASLEETIDITLLPRMDEYDRYVFVVLNGLVTGTGERLSTTELDMFIGEKYLVTIHRQLSSSVEWVHTQGEQLAAANMASPAHLAALIAQVSARGYLPVIEALEERLEAMEELAMSADPRVVPEVHALRRDVVVLRRSLAPMRDLFTELAGSVHPAIHRDSVRLFDRVYQQHLLIVESLDGARNLLSSIQETYRGAVAEQTNEIVKVLTVFSATLLPLSVIAGMWGMNFGEVPLSGHPYGFWLLVGAMAAIALGLWVYFGRRGFVGGPRLRELPKSVGLGLLQVTALPVKLVVGSLGTAKQVGRIVSEPDDRSGDG